MFQGGDSFLLLFNFGNHGSSIPSVIQFVTFFYLGSLEVTFEKPLSFFRHVFTHRAPKKGHGFLADLSGND